MKRVALIGTHGTRKSTRAMSIAASLKRKGVEAGFLEEIARTTPFKLNGGRTEEGQRWILYTQLAKEEERTLHGYEVLVCDRSVLDNYAYFTTAFGRPKELDDLVRGHMPRYNAVIRLPIIEGSLAQDGVRSTDPRFQKEIDEEVLKLLKEFGLEYKDWTSEEDAVNYILEKTR